MSSEQAFAALLHPAKMTDMKKPAGEIQVWLELPAAFKRIQNYGSRHIYCLLYVHLILI
uniref:Uncharacterized protein n=1 Tax=Cyprinodon variegatus TaxID=28743 RepID=A0A3Q2E2A7_CYPVA